MLKYTITIIVGYGIINFFEKKFMKFHDISKNFCIYAIIIKVHSGDQ